jgi:hypothetical protein
MVKYRMGYVYIIKGGAHFKIGMTTGNSMDRLRSLQTAAPFPLTLIHEILSDKPGELEAWLHQKFAPQRHHGEWFNLSENDLAWLMRCSGRPLKRESELQSPLPPKMWLEVERRGWDEYDGQVVELSPYTTITYYAPRPFPGVAIDTSVNTCGFEHFTVIR